MGRQISGVNSIVDRQIGGDDAHILFHLIEGDVVGKSARSPCGLCKNQRHTMIETARDLGQDGSIAWGGASPEYKQSDGSR
jgi:hypothetical protein